MPFNAAAALEKILSETEGAATSATPATREQNQTLTPLREPLHSCYTATETIKSAVEEPFSSPPSAPKTPRVVVDEVPIMEPLESDMEAYAQALQQHGPCGYGPMARVLGWEMTRTGQAEDALRKAGRIAYDRTGRGWLVEKGGKQ